MAEYTQLPADLPEPLDDGACDHLLTAELPATKFGSTDGHSRSLLDVPSRWLVVYVYPQTGGPDVVLPSNWDQIPGARGCTPQSCAFRDRHTELRSLGATVYGLSSQPLDQQQEFAERMHMPFPLLNDSPLKLAAEPLRLPTFAVGESVLYKRVTLVADQGHVARVFYPVFPSDRNAADVVDYLRAA